MSSTTNREVNGPAAQNSTPAFEQLLAALPLLSRDEKRVLLDRVLRELIGDKPEREYTLGNPDGSSYLFLVPPAIHVKYQQQSPEWIAEMERRRKNPGRSKPNGEFLAVLNKLQAAADAGFSQAEIRKLFRSMNPSERILAMLDELDAAEEAKQASERGS